MNTFRVTVILLDGFKSAFDEMIRPEFVKNDFDLNEHFHKATLGEEQIIPYLEDADAAVVGREKISRRVLEKAKNLRVISYFGTAVDSVDLHAAKARGIYVTNVPDANAISVAELTIGLIVNCMRLVTFSHEQLRDGLWKLAIGSECEGKALGIIGLGRIGRQVAKRAYYLGFDMKAFDILHDPEFASTYTIEYMSLDQLLCVSDIVSIHVPLNSGTRRLIGRNQIAQMKRSSYLINTSRGEVVDEEALIEALESNTIAGAALDVIENEPPDRDNRLFRFDASKTIITPHIGGGTIEATSRIAEVTRDNIILVSKGKKPRFIVNV
ncbi:MAG: hydroxyacid dehydrogenase [Proteobacteria bacterium]|nr:hydroxyacid dehydrogenase [Pseudomonadota bacterium]